MHGSSSDWSFRRAGIICSKTGEKLGTIEEEHYVRTPPGTRKSHTFHALRDLCEQPSGSSARVYEQTKPPNRRSRKRSLFFEMGERIRLFSTGSFVTTSVQATVPKTKSLNSLLQSSTVVNQSRRGFQRVAPSGSSSSLKFKELDQLEVELNRAPSQLGILCRHCSASDVCCPKAQQEMSSPSLPSLYSLAPSDLSTNEPICRICHCCWPADPSDPLISPCRCSGSLQYVHASCLMHWLDISSRKLHRPAICELCLYKYRRRRTFKYRDMKMPECSDRDVRYYTLFICALILMVLSAAATVVCFQMEKQTGSNQTIQFGQPSQTTTEAVPLELDSRDRLTKDMDNLLSTITLVSAIVFFFSFFLSMYAHVKSGLSFCNYLVLCWSSNLEWSIEEYKQSRDSQYLSKLEELRRKINEKAKKAADEVEPLRSSIIVIE